MNYVKHCQVEPCYQLPNNDPAFGRSYLGACSQTVYSTMHEPFIHRDNEDDVSPSLITLDVCISQSQVTCNQFNYKVLAIILSSLS